jgi:hypothetical protein
VNKPEKLEDHARGFAKTIPADYTGTIMRVVVNDRIDRNPYYVFKHTAQDDGTYGTQCWSRNKDHASSKAVENEPTEKDVC